MLDEIGETDNTEPIVFALFYTKDFCILEVYYDYDDGKIKYNVFEHGED